MTTTITTRIALALTLLALACAPAQAADPPQPPAGEGVLCVWAIYAATSEVGRRCFPNDAPEFQAELKSYLARIDAYVAKNSKMTPGEIEKFKRQQGLMDAPRETVCRGDGVIMYQKMKLGGGASLRQAADKMLARAGEPTWGTCF